MPAPQEITLLGSAARTATVDTEDWLNEAGHRGVIVFIDCTASADTPSVVFTIQGKEPKGNEYYTILASAAVTGAGNTTLKVFPGAPATANVSANDQLPLTWRLDATHADTDSITYAVTAVLLP